jgi:hypothetical protein
MTKATAALGITVLLAALQPAAAETYILPLEFRSPIKKILVQNGSAKLVEEDGKVSVYQLDVAEGVCISTLTVFSSLRPLLVRYDLCNKKPLSIVPMLGYYDAP